MNKEGIVKKPRLGVIVKKSKIKRNNFIPIILIILSYLIFFIFLKDKLLFTPDFGESDAYHFNLSLKYYLADNLKANKLPFWTDKVQGGFPLCSEGQIGCFFLPNYIFLKFFNFNTGYNLLFIFTLFSITIGFFYLLKALDISSIVALLFSNIFTLSGIISLRWVHLNLLQTFSFGPLLFYYSVMWLKTKKRRYLVLFPFILSQMIFAGYLQVVFIVLSGLFCWLIINLSIEKKTFTAFFQQLLIFIYLTISGFIFSLIQIIPTAVLMSRSERSLNLDYNTATSFPLTVNHLISFFLPTPFGSPKTGTYPAFSQNWGIFWENTPYLGLVSLIVIGISLVAYFKYKVNKKFIFYFYLAIFFILMALGKNSPLYFIYNFPPFTFFRTPSKYLLIAVFFLLIFLAYYYNFVYRQTRNFLIKFILILILITNIYQLLSFTFDYHLFIQNTQVLNHPAVTYKINSQSYYYSIGDVNEWNSIFLKSGWKTKTETDYYLFFKNYLYPNSNLIFNKKSININTGGFKLKRISYLNEIIFSGIQLKDNKYKIKPFVPSLFRILGIKYIISSLPINDQNLKITEKVNLKTKKIYLYEIANVDDNFYYLPKSISKIKYLNEFEKDLTENQLTIDYSLSEDINNKIDNNSKVKIIKASKTDLTYNLKGYFSNDAVVVFRLNFYPELKIKIDNKPVLPIKVNLVHIGVAVPEGTHVIAVYYDNYSYRLGLFITIIYLPLFLFIINRFV